MKILVLNAGSSSLKYQIFDMPEGEVLTKGMVERIGEPGSGLSQKTPGKNDIEIKRDIPDHETAIGLVIRAITDPKDGIIKSLSEVEAIGHRVLHGGEKYADSHLVTEDLKAAVEAYSDLGPLHNPANLMGIRAAEHNFPGIPNVAVFDTAFHQSMPKEAFLYPIPYAYYEEYGIRRYGFHGTSHKYVSGEAARLLGLSPGEANLITCHLGNGCSIAAIKGGKCADTSMGMTPLEGLMMGTRSGDIDPAIFAYLSAKTGKSAKEIETVLNKESGLLGISRISNDMRALHGKSLEGDEGAILAIAMFAYRARKYVGAYMAVLGRVDAIVFTGGMGEKAEYVRAAILDGMENFGVEIDPAKNVAELKEAVISKDSSRTKVMVVPTREELVIARDAYAIVSENNA
ncbi:MAG: acetate kinase [Rickettsiales bacterium]|nr:acetate kinase [Rickettsiales bacterium]